MPQVRGLSDRVEKDHKHVLDQVAGDLQSSMADAPTGTIAKAGDVMRTAEFAAGCRSLDLDRLLHHEERHSQQWAEDGYFGFMWHYAWDADGYEADTGLSDGGYR